jgi:type VI secretion system protein VasG
MVGVELKSLLRKLGPACMKALEGAAGIAVSRGHYEVLADHLVLRLLDDQGGDLAAIFRHFEVEPARVQRALEKALSGMRAGNQGRPAFSPHLIALLEDAFLLGAVELGVPRIRSGTVLLALLARQGRSSFEEQTDELEKIRPDELRRDFHRITGGSHEEEAAEEESGAPGAARAGGAAAPEEALARFCEDLTAKARSGKVDPVLGRDAEIRQMIDVLIRRRKNNPILVGEAGVGKTAVVEGFAGRVAANDVPSALRGVRVLNLDLGLLQAGASVKGEFENRLKSVISEIQAATIPTILFIDEAHTLIGAGGSAGTGDAANLLKPALARGELRTVAATTYSEFKKYIEKDPALARRFQPVHVGEPSVETTVNMLRGVRERFEAHHGVRVLDSAIEAAAALSDRYISGRQLPDKAVDLLDTACARVALGLSAKPAELDDVERRIVDLDLAIRALEADIELALVDRDEELAGLRDEREQRDAERDRLNERWQRELESVKRVHELQARLLRARGEKPEAQPAAPEAAPAAAVPAEAVAPVEPEDPAKLREEIEKALSELAALQGDAPLVSVYVTPEAVSQVVSAWTGIPVGRMVKDDLAQVLRLEEKLRERVVGQDHALAAIARKIRASKAGLQSPTQPIGVFLLVGPSGVGKTETAIALADLLFGGERFMVTINMSEFMEKHSVSRLIGSPPGYVGYGEGGVLTEAVRHRPYSVVLLDECEKADPEVMNLFYQVFDKGTLSDGEGRVVDFKNTIILMGSNLASDKLMAALDADELPTPAELDAAIRPVLQKHFKPALLGRMTVVPYYPLPTEVLRMIAEMKLRRVGDRLAEAHGMSFEILPEAKDALAERCRDPESGARNVDQMIDQNILPKVSLALLELLAEGRMPRKLVLGTNEARDFTFDFVE